MDTPLPAPSTLGDIYSMNPGAFGQAQGIIDQGQQAATLSQLTNQQSYNQNQVMDPLRAQLMQGQIDTSNAGLPGIMATSAMQTRKNSNENATNDSVLQNKMAELGNEKTKAHIQDISNAGDIFRQNAGQVLNNPIGAAQRVKQELTDAGHADMWNPAWDSFPPEGLAAVLKNQGDNIGQSTQKMLELSAGITAKKDMALDIEGKKQEGRQALRTSMNSSAANIEAMRQKGQDGRVKMNDQQAGNNYIKLADQAEQSGDMDMAQALRARASQAFAADNTARASGAAQSNEAKVDISGLTNGDVPQMPAAVVPPVPPLGATRQPAVGGAGPLPTNAAPVSAPGASTLPPNWGQSQPKDAQTQAIESAFGEPVNVDKYIYRQDPVTGKLQRKAR